MKTAQNYRHRVTFQEQVSVRDSNNDLDTVWQNAVVDGQELVDVPAEVLTGPGREFSNSGAVQADVTARIATRWFPGLSSSWRILWDGRVFGIEGDPDMDATARREWRIKASAGVNDGQ